MMSTRKVRISNASNATGHERSLSGLRKIISRSTSTTLHRSPRAMVAVSWLRADQTAPRSSARPTAPAGMSSSGMAISPTSESTSLPGPSSCIHFSRRTAEHEQRDDRDARKEHELKPDRPRPVEHVEAGDRQRGDAEEDDVEPARRRHFEGDEDEADDEPVPPEHGGAF